MTDDLIARLKAARTLRGRSGPPSLSARIAFDRLLRENADEIIAALEERERMRAVVEAAQRVADWGWGADAPAECQTDFIDLRAALDALDGKL